MGSIVTSGSQFPPGFRFHPTDQELIIHYIKNKVTSSSSPVTCIIADVDIYKFDPWELPDKAFFGEGEWFFFTPRDRKYPNGSRPNRAAASGYWKATGTDKPILASSGSQCLGVKKALVFYKGRPPKGIKTDWIMHEYRHLSEANPSSLPKHRGSMRLDDWVLCRVRHKGSTPTQTEEKSESSVLSTNPSANSNTKENKEKNNNTNCCSNWSEDKLMAQLLNSTDGSDSGSDKSSVDIASNEFAADEAPPSQLISSMLNSIKRTLSFGAMDELMLLQPNKRVHYWNNSSVVCEQLSPCQFVSVEQAFPAFT